MELRTGTYPTRYRLPVSYSTEIGRIITRWAFLEWRLRRVVNLLLDIGPKEGRLAVRAGRIDDYVTMIEELMKLKGITVQTDMAHLHSGLTQLEWNRDLLAHSVWVKHPATKTPMVQVLKGKWVHPSKPKTKRKVDPQGEPITLQQLRANTKSIAGAILTIHALYEEISRQLPLPRKSSEP